MVSTNPTSLALDRVRASREALTHWGVEARHSPLLCVDVSVPGVGGHWSCGLFHLCPLCEAAFPNWPLY